MQNMISGTLSAEDMQAIKGAIATIRQRIPFLRGLSPEERQGLSKMGARSRAFVEQAQQTANHQPGLLARDFDLAEYNRDVDLFRSLSDINQDLNLLATQVDDTLLAAGSDSFVGSLEVYHAAKRIGKGTGMDDAVNAMGQRFRRSRIQEEEPVGPVAPTKP